MPPSSLHSILIVLLAVLLVTGCTPEPPDDTPLDPGLAPQAPVFPLQEGFQTLLTEPERGLFAYAAEIGGVYYVAVVNRSGEAHGLRIEAPVPGEYELAYATAPDRPYRIQSDLTGVILEISEQSGLLLRHAGAADE